MPGALHCGFSKSGGGRFDGSIAGTSRSGFTKACVSSNVNIGGQTLQWHAPCAKPSAACPQPLSGPNTMQVFRMPESGSGRVPAGMTTGWSINVKLTPTPPKSPLNKVIIQLQNPAVVGTAGSTHAAGSGGSGGGGVPASLHNKVLPTSVIACIQRNGLK